MNQDWKQKDGYTVIDPIGREITARQHTMSELREFGEKFASAFDIGDTVESLHVAVGSQITLPGERYKILKVQAPFVFLKKVDPEPLERKGHFTSTYAGCQVYLPDFMDNYKKVKL